MEALELPSETIRRSRPRLSELTIEVGKVVAVDRPDSARDRTCDFPGESKFNPIHVLDIPDDYQFMDDELVELIRSAAVPVIAGRLFL